MYPATKLTAHAAPITHQIAASRNRRATRLVTTSANPQPATMKTAGKETHGVATAPTAMPQTMRADTGRLIACKEASDSATATATSSEYCFTSVE